MHCTSLSSGNQVDSSPLALHFGNFDGEFTCFERIFDVRLGVRLTESLYIDVKRGFGYRKYEKVILRKSYISIEI